MDKIIGSGEVDFTKIKYPKVKDFMVRHGLREPGDFANMRPVCYDPAIHNTYHSHHEHYLIRQPVDYVWAQYKSIHPSEAWKGEMVSFGLQYGRRTNTISYLDDPYSGMEPGQVIILNLTLFFGLVKIAVAHEVTEVNDGERTIKLCYMQGGASAGSQWIKLAATKEGYTSVSHQTYYKSNSAFRDRRLYPMFHTKAVSEFHHNVKLKAEGGNADTANHANNS